MLNFSYKWQYQWLFWNLELITFNFSLTGNSHLIFHLFTFFMKYPNMLNKTFPFRTSKHLKKLWDEKIQTERTKKHFLTVSVRELLFLHLCMPLAARITFSLMYFYLVPQSIRYYRALGVVSRNIACYELQSTQVTVTFALDSSPLLLNYRPKNFMLHSETRYPQDVLN